MKNLKVYSLNNQKLITYGQNLQENVNKLLFILNNLKCPKNEILFLLISDSKDKLHKESVYFEKILMKIIQNQDISEMEINEIKKTIILIIDFRVRGIITCL